MNEVLANARRIVIKVGSSLVTNEGRGLDSDAIGNWCRQLAALASQGRELVMVSSGNLPSGLVHDRVDLCLLSYFVGANEVITLRL